MKLKVMTYNIHKGFSTGGVKYILRTIKEALSTTAADIVLLQEVVGQHRKSEEKDWPTESQFEFLADQLWSHYSYAKNAIFSQLHYGNAILSQFPIVQEKHTVMSTNRFEQRGLLHCEVEIPELKQKIHLYNVHLDLLRRGRRIQYHKIVSQIQNDVKEKERFIMAGDFNDWTGELNQMFIEHLGLEEAHTKFHNRPARSFPSFFPVLTLDRIYSRNMDILSCKALIGKPWHKLSDHIPLMVEYAL